MNNKYLFDEFVIKESSIGIYSIPKIRDGRNIDEIINEIFNNGIIINWGGITNDFNFLGKKEESTYFEASDYNGFLYECNIVISIPQVIDNYFIGNIPRTINIKNEIDSEYHKIIKFNPVNKYVVENNKFPK